MEEIRVLEVSEVESTPSTENLTINEPIKKIDAKDSSQKISTKLFLGRRKVERKKEDTDSDNSVSMESLENSPVKAVRSVESSELTAENDCDGSDENKSINSSFELPSGCTVEHHENSVTNRKWKTYVGPDGRKFPSMVKLKQALDVVDIFAAHSKKSKGEEQKIVMQDESPVPPIEIILDDTLPSEIRKSKPSLTNNAFLTLMKNSHKSFEAPEKEPDSVAIVTRSSKAPIEITLDDTLNSPPPVKNNVFLTLMKNSRRSFEPPEVETSADISGQIDEALGKEMKVEDSTLKNMLSVMQTLESEEDEDKQIVTVKRKKKKRKRRFQQNSSSAPPSPKPDVEKIDADENEEVQMITEATAEVFEVQCRGTVGQLHLAKFVSGGEGKSIAYAGQWLTPNQFEKEAGSRSKKYKVSLFVNKKPLRKLLEERNILTRSRSVSSSGRKTSLSEFDSEASAASPRPARRKKKIKKVQEVLLEESESDADMDADAEEEVTEIRSSGRIRRNIENIKEKKRIAEEQDNLLEELDRKEREKKKLRTQIIKNLTKKKSTSISVPQSADVTSDSEDSTAEDSDCKFEDVVVKTPPRKSKKILASIFTKGKVPVKPAEDPAVAAARRAFLMSSAPAELLSQISVEGGSEGGAGWGAWPGPDSLPSHTGLPAALPTPSFVPRTRVLPETELQLPAVKAGQLVVAGRGEEQVSPALCRDRLSEAAVLATLEQWAASRPGLRRQFSSLAERKVEAEMVEREAAARAESLQDAEERRIRGNRRRSRRSRETADTAATQYRVNTGSQLLWTGKYQPRCGADLAGLQPGAVTGLRTWLAGWRSAGTGAVAGPECSGTTSMSEWGSESEAEGGQSGNSTALLVGPPGSGKTAAVYALAAEMGFNVLEVNASSNRSGRQVC